MLHRLMGPFGQAGWPGPLQGARDIGEAAARVEMSMINVEEIFILTFLLFRRFQVFFCVCVCVQPLLAYIVFIYFPPLPRDCSCRGFVLFGSGCW